MNLFKISLKGILSILSLAIFATFIACEDGDRTGKNVTSGDPGLPQYTVTCEVDGTTFDSKQSHATIIGKTVKEEAKVKANDKVFKGTEIVFKAIPKDGYECDYNSWTGTAKSTDTKKPRESKKVTATGDITVGINTTKLSDTKYNVTFDKPANGKLSASTPAGTPVVSGTPKDGTKEITEVNSGTTVTFKATPDKGYKVSSWSVGGVTQTGTEKTFDYKVTGAVTVAVTFVQE